MGSKRGAAGVPLRPRADQLDNLLLGGGVRERHLDEMVQVARRDQRGIEHVGAAGGADDEDARGGIDAVELLAQRGDETGARLPSLRRRQQVIEGQRVELVEEQDGRPLAEDRKSTRLNSSHIQKSRMPSSA